MRARNTLSLILFILLIPGIVLVAMLYVSPSSVQGVVNSLASRLFPEAQVESSYSTFVYASFVYVVVLVSAILYLILSDIARKISAGENRE